MAGLYTTFKVFTPGEILTAADLNSSEQQHVTYNTALATRGYSETLEQSRVQMPTTTLSLSLADELARLREKLRLLGGVTYWDQIVGPSLSPFALPKGQVFLPLEGATLPDGTSGNAFPTVVERISTAPIPPGNTQPKIVETVFDFDSTIPQYIMWKIKTPLGYIPGELIEVILTFSVLDPPAVEGTPPPPGNKFRPVVGAAPVRDELDNVNTAVMSASMFGPDNQVIPSPTMQKEYRIAIPATNITEDQKVIITVGCLPATLDNYVGKRRLEAAIVEFSRGAFQLDDPGMPNPMTDLGDIIVGGNTGTPQRLAVGIENQILTVDSGIPQWIDPPGGFNNPMTDTGDLIQGGFLGEAARLPVGPDGFILTVVSGAPAWQPSSGVNDPMTQEGDIIYRGSGIPARLGIGVENHILTCISGYPAWVAAPVSGFPNPMTTLGDIITGDVTGAAQRLAVGTDGFVLTVVAGVPAWTSAPVSGFANPMTTLGDVITGAASGVAQRLAIGTNGFVLTVVGGVPAWAALAVGLTNPMTGVGDMIRGGTAGVATRLAPGSDTHVLTMSGGVPVWAPAPGAGGGMSNPMTTLGDVIMGGGSGLPLRLGIGTDGHVLTVVAGAPGWAAAPAGFTNPMTTAADLIMGGASGTPTRLAKGATTGHVLTVTGASTIGWQVLPAAGMTNPMTTTGDIIRGGASGVPTRLAIGTNGHVLTLVAGIPAWQALPVFTPSFPLLAPDGGAVAPPYSFAASPSSGLFRDGAGHLTLEATGSSLIVFTRNSAIAWWIDSNLGWQPGADVGRDIGAAATRVRDLWLGRDIDFTNLASAPATPATGHVVVYSKTDKKMYSKDDAGVETPLGGAVSGANTTLRLPISQADVSDGTAGNLPAEFVREISTGTLTNAPKASRTYARFDSVTDESLMWSFQIPQNYVSGGKIRIKWRAAAAVVGNVVWKAGAAVTIDGVTNNTSVVFNAADSSGPIAVPGTVGLIVETLITLTVTNFAAGRWVTVFVGRDADDAADTMTGTTTAGDAILVGVQFEYV